MRLHRDEKGIVLTWLLKITLLLAVIGVVMFDAVSVLVNGVTLDSAADDTAIAVSLVVGGTPPSHFTDEEIVALARDVIRDPANAVTGARVMKKGTEIDDAGVVHIRLRRRAQTLVAGRITALRRYVIATGQGTAGTN